MADDRDRKGRGPPRRFTEALTTIAGVGGAAGTLIAGAEGLGRETLEMLATYKLERSDLPKVAAAMTWKRLKEMGVNPRTHGSSILLILGSFAAWFVRDLPASRRSVIAGVMREVLPGLVAHTVEGAFEGFFVAAASYTADLAALPEAEAEARVDAEYAKWTVWKTGVPAPAAGAPAPAPSAAPAVPLLTGGAQPSMDFLAGLAAELNCGDPRRTTVAALVRDKFEGLQNTDTGLIVRLADPRLLTYGLDYQGTAPSVQLLEHSAPRSGLLHPETGRETTPLVYVLTMKVMFAEERYLADHPPPKPSGGPTSFLGVPLPHGMTLNFIGDMGREMLDAALVTRAELDRQNLAAAAQPTALRVLIMSVVGPFRMIGGGLINLIRRRSRGAPPPTP